MAVEASGGGGGDIGSGGEREVCGRSEQDARKEREMGREYEHIACRDGDENYSSGTDGSFVMVTVGGDSDGRSESSEKDADLDVGGGGAGDPPTGKAEDANSRCDSCADDVMDNEEKLHCGEATDVNGVEEAGVADYGGKAEKTLAEVGEVQDNIASRADLEEERVVVDDYNNEDEKKEAEVVSKNDQKNLVEEGLEAVAAPINHLEAESGKLLDQEEVQLEETVLPVVPADDGKEAAIEAASNVDGPVAALTKEVQNHVEECPVVDEITEDLSKEDANTEDSNKEENSTFLENEEQIQIGEGMSEALADEEEQNHLEDGFTVAEHQKDGNVEAIENMNNDEQEITVEAPQNEPRKQVGDEPVDVEDLSKEDAVVKDLKHEEQAVTNDDNEEQLTDSNSTKRSSSDPGDGKHELEPVLAESNNFEPSAIHLANPGVEHVEHEEMKKVGDDDSSVTNEEVDAAAGTEERKHVNAEITEEISLEIHGGNNVESSGVHQQHTIDASGAELDPQEKEHEQFVASSAQPAEENLCSGSEIHGEASSIQDALSISPTSSPAPAEQHLGSSISKVEEESKDVGSASKLDGNGDAEASTMEILHEKTDPPSSSKSVGEPEEKEEHEKGEIQATAEVAEQEKGPMTEEERAPAVPDGAKPEIHVRKYCMIRVPRLNRRAMDDELQAKIRDAQLELEERTHGRDSLMAELENMRKALSSSCHKRDAAVEEEKKAKALLNAKRMEMDSFQAAIGKGKAAASYLDTMSQISSLQHKIQHETISLKDEKKFLHELNQLKHERELHLFNKCSQSEIDDALKQKEEAESSLRALKKDYDGIRSAHMKAEEQLKAASKMYVEQFNKIKEKEQKWKTANEQRQNAYKAFQALKSDKMELHSKYMDDFQAAKKYSSSGDVEALERHCAEQVERMMQLWNDDDGFRRLYVDSNVNSTLRRFGTMDGRNLAPNEARAAVPSRLLPPPPRTPAVPSLAVEEPPSLAQAAGKPPSKGVEVERERKPTKEEEEQARLAEERAGREEEIRKEKLRMEQITKAKEADDRKRRKAEKAQARAQYRAQKEAETRELKKAKKEIKKKADGGEGDAAEASAQEAAREQENNPTKRTSSSRHTASALNKFGGRVQPVPPPLRNKGKRRSTAWLWTALAAAAVGGLFVAGNYVSFSNLGLLDLGFLSG